MTQPNQILGRFILYAADRIRVIQHLLGGPGDERVAQPSMPMHFQTPFSLAFFRISLHHPQSEPHAEADRSHTCGSEKD